MKRLILLLCCSAAIAFTAMAQQGPAPAAAMQYTGSRLAEQVALQLSKIDWGKAHKEASSGTALYTIPVVIHVLHNYGPELLPDTTLYRCISELNGCFLKTNADTAEIIDKFKPVAANTQIAFKMATKDPAGNPTKGIDRIYTYLTYNSSDQLKVNQWPQDRYLNVWITAGPSASLALLNYSYSSLTAAYYPYYDGIVLSYYLPSAVSGYARYFAKYLNLPSICGYSAGICEDGDMIADTPPCDNSNYYTPPDLYPATCDTPNIQNFMVYNSGYGRMFTYGQAQYMQYILQIDIGKRDSLISAHNIAATGINEPVPDLPPVADFSVTNLYHQPVSFFCTNQVVRFDDHSWNDTIANVAWTFSNDANIPAATTRTVANKFHQPGWVVVSLAATGNNTGTTTLTNTHALYIADSIPTYGPGYVQEFSGLGSMLKWPIFNYYSNSFKWQASYSAGYFDQACLQYTGYDRRSFPENMTGTPHGDVDDIFTPPFDLAGAANPCYLNFMSSGATRMDSAVNRRDTLEIDYSTDRTSSWHTLAKLTQDELSNKGKVTTPYTPAGPGDWAPHSLLLPADARTAYTIFRLRYHPGADTTGMSTGNNFYLDHFNFNSYTEDVAAIPAGEQGILLQPNPTHGACTITIRNNAGLQHAAITICDITGKAVYEIAVGSGSTTAAATIPVSALKAPGMYLVHIIAAGINETRKLVVY